MPDSNAAAASILIVDDTPTNLALMVELLQPHYRTRVAINGEKAIALALGAEHFGAWRCRLGHHADLACQQERPGQEWLAHAVGEVGSEPSALA